MKITDVRLPWFPLYFWFVYLPAQGASTFHRWLKAWAERNLSAKVGTYTEHSLTFPSNIGQQAISLHDSELAEQALENLAEQESDPKNLLDAAILDSTEVR